MTGFTSEGAGVCRISGRAVFVPRALPGERWRVRIVKVTKTAVYGRGEERLTSSPERVAPACPNFGRCGGCDLMHMSYAAELTMKLERVNEAFRRLGGLELRAERIIGSDSVEGYRNKAVYAVGETGEGPAAGFYRPGSHDVVPAPACLLQSEEASACAGAVVAWMCENGLRAWDGKEGVRHVYTRRARDGAAICCVVVGRRLSPALSRSLTAALRAACPKLVGVVECVNASPGNTVLSGQLRTLWGSGTLLDTLCGSEFELSPRAFYQINPPQAERLYQLALDYALPEPGGTALDLYCGAGTISLCLAKRAARVIGAEIVPEAVENARANAARNGVKNAEFICADAGEAAKELKNRGMTPDVIVVDPPRKGLEAAALEQIASMHPPRLTYVSCDPATLARDLKRLTELGYRAEKAVAVDMFPRTSHVETVVLLGRKFEKSREHVYLDYEPSAEIDLPGGATYSEIKQWIQAEYDLKVSSLYVAQVKQKHGIVERECYNKPKSENAKQPKCPPEKEAAIEAALKHVKMILRIALRFRTGGRAADRFSQVWRSNRDRFANKTLQSINTCGTKKNCTA